MKRTPLKSGGPLTRRTPLTSAASLPRSPFPRSTRPVQPPVARPATPRAPRRATGPQRAVKDLVWERDRGVCVACGKPERYGDGLTVHHRRNRGKGGSTAADTNLPGNLLLVHASLNVRFEAESSPSWREAGWKVSHGVTLPADVPVLYPDGRWWLLDNEGGRTMTGAPT